MTDLHALLPDFATERYAALLAGLETHRISLSEVLTLDAAEIGRRTRLPLLDLQLFCQDVRGRLRQQGTILHKAPTHPGCISTLDDRLDAALGGGFAPGQLAEVVGESGVGKTQLLLGLLLAVQLPPPRGLGRRALYIATEAPLATARLAQMVRAHRLGASAAPFLARIATINTPDLEAQDHILTHQLPVQLDKAAGAFGLVVIDSVAANFRPFFGGAAAKGGETLAARSLELARLGMLLRTLAQKHNLAVVVANQVADRFERLEGLPAIPRWGADGGAPGQPAKRARPGEAGEPLERSSQLPLQLSQLSQLPSQLPSQLSQSLSQPPTQPPVLLLDHQQRWFTGWGDDEPPGSRTTANKKTPALGLVWATQLAVRVVLVKTPRGGDAWTDDTPDPQTGVVGAPRLRQSWRRWLKVVFGPATAGGTVEYTIGMGGLRHVDESG